MAAGAIYFDDSGNPGAQSGSDFLPSSRKSWTAVVVPSVIASEVQRGMDIFLRGVRTEFGVDELHFTEIYSGTGLWRNVLPDKRAEIIHLMSALMSALGLPVLHQTVADYTLLDHPDVPLDMKAGEWKMDDHSQLGLLILCSQVSKHVRMMKQKGPQDFDLPLPLYVDEGILPAGKERKLPNWHDVIEGPVAKFRNSTDVPGLQLADFAAFIINRSQWMAVTRRPGPIRVSEQVILDAAAGLNILNLSFHPVAPEEFGKESYEKWQSAQRVAKGLKARPPKSR